MDQVGIKFIDFSSGSHQETPVQIQVTKDNCHEVISHKTNKDGYIRKVFLIDKKKTAIMYHRFIWTRENGEIPLGYEVDHICRNRKCCNIKHLQLLTKSEHKSKTNRERYAERIDGVCFAIKEGFSLEEIVKTFNVSIEYVKRHRRNVNAIH